MIPPPPFLTIYPLPAQQPPSGSASRREGRQDKNVQTKNKKKKNTRMVTSNVGEERPITRSIPLGSLRDKGQLMNLLTCHKYLNTCYATRQTSIHPFDRSTLHTKGPIKTLRKIPELSTTWRAVPVAWFLRPYCTFLAVSWLIRLSRYRLFSRLFCRPPRRSIY